MKNHPLAAATGLPRDPARERNWRGLLKQFAASGQSVRQFCATRRLRETAFYFWRREIQRRDRQTPAERRSGNRPPRRLTFAQVRLQPPRPAISEEGPRLRLAGGRELLLPASMPVEHVARLVHAIEGLP